MTDFFDIEELERLSEEADRLTEEQDLQDYLEYVREHLDDND